VGFLFGRRILISDLCVRERLSNLAQKISRNLVCLILPMDLPLSLSYANVQQYRVFSSHEFHSYRSTNG
jgi:hypothetical protein